MQHFAALAGVLHGDRIHCSFCAKYGARYGGDCTSSSTVRKSTPLSLENRAIASTCAPRVRVFIDWLATEFAGRSR